MVQQLPAMGLYHPADEHHPSSVSARLPLLPEVFQGTAHGGGGAGRAPRSDLVVPAIAAVAEGGNENAT
jgi:hypothetical protein